MKYYQCNKKELKITLIVILIIIMFLVFSSFFFLHFCNKTQEEVTYITPNPVYKTIDKIVEKDVYRQETPIIPVKTNGKEVIVLDKSGSMKDFVTNIYTSNVKFFTTHNVWAFDTKLFQDVSMDNIEFGGDTNIFQVINMAAEKGYNTVWLCSDLEHNTGDTILSEDAKKMTIIVYSPKPLDEEKTRETIEMLKMCKTKIIKML